MKSVFRPFVKERGRTNTDCTTFSNSVLAKEVSQSQQTPYDHKKKFKSLENDLELLQSVIASTSDASIARVKTFKTKFDALFASTDDSHPVVKKKRGRPKKVDTIEPVQKKKRGRPPKDKTLDIIPKKPRGRPPKQAKQ